jgi:DNA-binding FadR family transcriptional regulator
LALKEALSAMTPITAPKADIAFHQAVGEASHNVLLGHLSAALLRLMHDNIRLNLGELKMVPAASRLLMNQHAAIHAAIRERKPQPPAPPPKRTSTSSAKPWPSRCAPSPAAKPPRAA